MHVKRGPDSPHNISDRICVWYVMSRGWWLRSVVIGVTGALPLVTPLRAQSTHDGRAGQTEVAIPRFEDAITIDGRLDEAPWVRAARLTGFSQFNPTDGRPALDSTEALVWYGPEAIYFAVRAFAPAGTVRGTLADRDRIQNDDHVQFILDTFNDRRQAYVFAVNPLGVQSDGIRTEVGGGGPGRGRGGGGGGGGGGFSRATLGNADLNQDLIWQSKGEITEWGYQVELRIPYKSLRFRATEPRSWGLNVVRVTQRNNYQDTWTVTKRGLSSFLIQSGRLVGLRDLNRGLVLDVTPVVTSSLSGTPDAVSTQWRYGELSQAGADVRWGVTPSLTMNATINPDFSQVEADVGQIPGDVRFAVNFPELRPFFVEGNEQVDTPNQLVYTRRIVQPVAASKLTGKVGRFDLGVLSAVDNATYSANGSDQPLFNILRLRRDVGTQSNIGFTVTDRRERGDFNQVLNADGRFIIRDLYQASYQVAHAQTRTDAEAQDGTLWEVSLDRTGRSWGFRNSLEGVSADFTSQSGFIPRTDYAQTSMSQRYTWFGARGSRVEQMTYFGSWTGTWAYRDLFERDRPLEHRTALFASAQLRGGWNVNLTVAREGFGFLPSQYERYYVERRSGGVITDTAKYTPTGRVPGRQLQFRVSTPQFRRFGLSAGTTLGRDAEFLEGSQARRFDYNASLDLRPTPQLRASLILLHQGFRRARDGSTILQTDIPRLRVEYQLSRAIFFRFVGQYEARERDAYRDPATEDAILFRDDGGVFTRSEASRTNRLRADWLFSYFPSPGRVLYLGYGASLEEPEAFRFQQVQRTRDGFFVKFSWLYRVP